MAKSKVHDTAMELLKGLEDIEGLTVWENNCKFLRINRMGNSPGIVDGKVCECHAMSSGKQKNRKSS